MDTMRRRAFMQGAAVGALAFTVDGVEQFLLPSEARAQGAALKTLTADEARRLEAVSETLVPGAREAGVAYFVDQQCSVPAHEALLNIRITNVRPPFVNFFRAALTEIDRQCNAKHGKPFADLAAGEQHDFINIMRQGKHPEWKGPPAQPAIYGAFRANAVDVVYGTVEGTEKLGVPYMALVAPKARW